MLTAAVRYEEVLAPILIGAALFGLVLLSTDDQRARIAFGFAIGASILLTFGATLMSLCTLVEESTDLYRARCESRTYDWPLLGIPTLLGLALFARSIRDPRLWILGGAVFLTALGVPFLWLTTAG